MYLFGSFYDFMNVNMFLMMWSFFFFFPMTLIHLEQIMHKQKKKCNAFISHEIQWI